MTESTVQRAAIPKPPKDPDARLWRAERVAKPRRSRLGIETMCHALLRRLPGMPPIDRVVVEITPCDGRGRTWTVADLEPRQGAGVLDRARTALDPWRDRYDIL
ncbi:hypothetical protein [Labrys wisconsinensis]|uniref:Uncharacterized protein n=1 Tax=Labrys wisconsinensis TaxID=425677 RepID=A0ABU0JH95_9HYPH|nr:hypothetical protein [Labrys wisconsinensis]MDQ0472965.1 hypothetical protein [Labrys wisconsinensis]